MSGGEEAEGGSAKRLEGLEDRGFIFLVVGCLVWKSDAGYFRIWSWSLGVFRVLNFCRRSVLCAACCVLRAACCVLRAACCVLRAACCVLGIGVRRSTFNEEYANGARE